MSFLTLACCRSHAVVFSALTKYLAGLICWKLINNRRSFKLLISWGLLKMIWVQFWQATDNNTGRVMGHCIYCVEYIYMQMRVSVIVVIHIDGLFNLAGPGSGGLYVCTSDSWTCTCHLIFTRLVCEINTDWKDLKSHHILTNTDIAPVFQSDAPLTSIQTGTNCAWSYKVYDWMTGYVHYCQS